MSNVVDLFLVYQFIRKLSKPFRKWDAYKLGIIDRKGNILKDKSQRKTVKEKKAFTKYDLLILNLKKILEKIPGGRSKTARYSAALYLMKEHHQKDSNYQLNEEVFHSYYDFVSNYLSEEVPANAVGAGDVDGIGVGPRGEPGVKKKEMNSYKRKNKQQQKRLKKFKEYDK